ncbi:hypothetical protein BVER_04499c [Candidatus Burkholderia verschuerenii]|uniref:2-oxoglutarate dehydrogenase n=1 Tax=Candidatus Burkholderia verschuerenii TaxID=242163 RepID=A0A0L0MC01_9BURK|nr:DUF3005 domain-containing protein [Candidatus Burkholderia verschuerenii]KND59878.1 hypothetical protein BVER_04499c [Candidatus Burkholderia verschuerenii]
MSDANTNDPKDKQSDHVANSPIKTPGAETAHVKMSDAQKAAAGGEVHAGANARSDLSRTSADTTIGPDGMREMRPRGADVLNDGTMDDIVDADGKNIQAQRYDEMMREEPDAVINSNSTTVNYVDTPDDGLGGFDSRPGRNGVLLMLERGWRMIDRGMVAPAVPEVEDKLRFEGRDAHGHTLRGRKHYALNHMRPSRLFVLERS